MYQPAPAPKVSPSGVATLNASWLKHLYSPPVQHHACADILNIKISQFPALQMLLQRTWEQLKHGHCRAELDVVEFFPHEQPDVAKSTKSDLYLALLTIPHIFLCCFVLFLFTQQNQINADDSFTTNYLRHLCVWKETDFYVILVTSLFPSTLCKCLATISWLEHLCKTSSPPWLCTDSAQAFVLNAQA